MRVLITGVSGFIGGHLYQARPDTVDVWGTYLNFDVPLTSERFIKVNLRNSEAVRGFLDDVKPDLVIHCAAVASVSTCERAPITSFTTNTLATATLADLCKQRRLRLIFLSSDMVFDGGTGHYSEENEPAPVNFYGWTKLSAERAVAQLGDRGVIIRVNNTYGRPAMGGTSFSEEVIQTVRSGKPYHLYADQYRSFISVKNVIRCIWEIAAGDFSGLIHLGGTDPVDRVTFAKKLAERVGLDQALLRSMSGGTGPHGMPYPKNNTFDLTLAKNLLRTPLLNLEDGLVLEYGA